MNEIMFGICRAILQNKGARIIMIYAQLKITLTITVVVLFTIIVRGIYGVVFMS